MRAGKYGMWESAERCYILIEIFGVDKVDHRMYQMNENVGKNLFCLVHFSHLIN